MLEAARTYASPFCWRVSAVCCRLGLTTFTLVAEETIVQGRRTTKTTGLFAPILFGGYLNNASNPINYQQSTRISDFADLSDQRKPQQQLCFRCSLLPCKRSVAGNGIWPGAGKPLHLAGGKGNRHPSCAITKP